MICSNTFTRQNTSLFGSLSVCGVTHRLLQRLGTGSATARKLCLKGTFFTQYFLPLTSVWVVAFLPLVCLSTWNVLQTQSPISGRALVWNALFCALPSALGWAWAYALRKWWGALAGNKRKCQCLTFFRDSHTQVGWFSLFLSFWCDCRASVVGKPLSNTPLLWSGKIDGETALVFMDASMERGMC